jgi:hypothetical protein
MYQAWGTGPVFVQTWHGWSGVARWPGVAWLASLA